MNDQRVSSLGTVWRKINALCERLEAIREELGAITIEAAMDHENIWDVEGVCLVLQGAERYLKTFADMYVEYVSTED